MKRLLILAFCLAIISCSMVSAEALLGDSIVGEIQESGYCGDNLTWSLDENGTLRIQGTGDMRDYYNASTYGPIDGFAPWYSFRDLVERVIIENGVTSIGQGAFLYCVNLTDVTIPETVEYIRGEGAFYGCISLQEITIPEGVIEIGEYTFADCISLRKVSLPDSLEAMKDGVFTGCKNLRQIDLPVGVDSVGAYAFRECSHLERIGVRSNLSSIGSWAFDECTSLEEIYFDGDEEDWNAISIDASNTDLRSAQLHYGEILPDREYAVLETVDEGSAGDNIAWKLSNTGMLSFYGTGDMISRTGSLYSWSNYSDIVKNIEVLDGITSIGISAFSGFEKNLKTVYIADSVISIGDQAFLQDYRLKYIHLPEQLQQIGERVFQYCYDLETITIPDAVTTIGSAAFHGCESLRTVNIPLNATLVDNPFSGCISLKSIELSVDNQNYTTVDDVVFDRNLNKLIIYPAGKSEFSYAVPDSVTVIGKGAFSWCSTIHNLYLPEGIQRFEESAFNTSWYSNGNPAMPLSDIYYAGSEEQWGQIEKGEYNEILDEFTTVHFNANSLPEGPMELTPGTEVSVVISEPGEMVDLSFAPDVSGEYIFYSLGHYDTYGYLYDTNNRELSRSDDDGEGNNFKIVYYLVAGETYYYKARFYDSENIGQFKVVLAVENHLSAIPKDGKNALFARVGMSLDLEVEAYADQGNLSFQWYYVDPVSKEEKEINLANSSVCSLIWGGEYRQYKCIVADDFDNTASVSYEILQEDLITDLRITERIDSSFDTLEDYKIIRINSSYDGSHHITWSGNHVVYGRLYNEELKVLDKFDGDDSYFDGLDCNLENGKVYYLVLEPAHAEDVGSFYVLFYKENYLYARSSDGNNVYYANPGDVIHLEVTASCEEGGLQYSWSRRVNSDGYTVLEEIEGEEQNTYSTTWDGSYQGYSCRITDDYGNWTNIEFLINNTNDLPENAILINEENFPDREFRRYISQTIDNSGNGYLDENDILNTTHIEIDGYGANSLEGIELFANLESLTCGNNNLTSIDVSENTLLSNFDCSNNQLKELDVSSNTRLGSLSCYHNELESLYLSSNTELKFLNCSNNSLSELDLSNNQKLYNIACAYNPLTSLTFGENEILDTIDCGDNNLTQLDLSGLKNLKVLDIRQNNFTKIDISSNTAMTALYCRNNQIEMLDVSHNPALIMLSCAGNPLTSLDLSQNNLETLDIGDIKREITATEGIFDLTALPGFDVSRASNWRGGSVEGTSLKVTKEKVTYNYDCGNGRTVMFTLLVDGFVPEEEPIPDLALSTQTEVMLEEEEYAYFRFIPEESGKYSFYSSGSHDTYGYLYNENMETITTNDDSGDDSNFMISVVLNRGVTYYFGARFYDSDDSGSFNVQLDYEGDVQDRILDISLHNTLDVTLAAGEMAYFRFIPTQDGTYEFYSTGDLDTYGYLYDEYFQAITSNDDESDDDNFFISHDLMSGVTYYWGAKLYSSSSSGSFAVHLESKAEEEILSISLGTPVDVTLRDGRFAYFIFVPSETGVYSFYSLGDRDTVGYIYDENRDVLKMNDDGNNASNFYITMTLQEDVPYYLGIKLYNSDEEDTVQVQVDLRNEEEGLLIYDGTFPDEQFQSYVLSNIDSNDDGVLNEEEISSTTSIDVENRDIESLDGIQYFTSLEELYCSDNEISSIDIADLSQLRYLECSNNLLDVLALYANPALAVLHCSANNISSIDLSNNLDLNDLDCSGNQLNELDVTKNTNLHYLDCGSNLLDSLNVEHNPELYLIRCNDNQITEINTSSLLYLSEFNCANNELKRLDVSQNRALQYLHCGSNHLSNMDLSQNTSIEEFSCEDNQLEVRSINGCFNLSALPFFNVSHASGWNGGSVSDTLLRFDSNAVSYSYDCGNGKVMQSSLIQNDVPLENLNCLVLPKALRTVDVEAFMTIGAEAVIVPEGCTSIGPRAFAGCDQLQYVQIPSTVGTIAEDAFEGCMSDLIVDRQN